MSGRFTGEYWIFNSRSPLSEPVYSRFVLTQISDDGEIHRGAFLFNSRSPPCVFAFWGFNHFEHFHKMGPHGMMVNIIGVVQGPILYIYSLRHFLTTKGALIDGDGYPPKSDQNDPKKVTKMTNFSLNLMTKKCQKTRFLMWKSTFSLNLTTIDQKVTKIDQKSTTN